MSLHVPEWMWQTSLRRLPTRGWSILRHLVPDIVSCFSHHPTFGIHELIFSPLPQCYSGPFQPPPKFVACDTQHVSLYEISNICNCSPCSLFSQRRLSRRRLPKSRPLEALCEILWRLWRAQKQLRLTPRIVRNEMVLLQPYAFMRAMSSTVA